MGDLFHGPGFLGTNGNFLADLGLFLVGGVSLLMTVGAGLNLVFVLWLMVGPYIGEVALEFGSPPYPPGFYWVPTVHGLIGLAAVFFGLLMVVRGHEMQFLPEALRFNNYKPFMRVTYGLYMLATLIGIGVYLMWFVISPEPPDYTNWLLMPLA
ncbi:MAG: hypothetical protein GYB64_13510 [Chloroflexi bacterium]|nr:hypothetical protein [Chloroflexota bacterium]